MRGRGNPRPGDGPTGGSPELPDPLHSALESRGVCWVVGPAHCGKSTRIARALSGHASVPIDGRRLASFDRCLAAFCEWLGPPGAISRPGLLRWLREGLPRLAGAEQVVVLERHDRMDVEFAELLVSAVHHTLMPYALLIETRHPTASVRLTHRVRCLQLQPATDAERGVDRDARAAQAALQLWQTLEPAARQACARLALAETPTEDRWAAGDATERVRDGLRGAGLLGADGRPDEALVGWLHANQAAVMRRTERALLAHLIRLPELGPRQLARAVELLGKHPGTRALVDFMRRHGPGLQDNQLIAMQTDVDQILDDARLPARAKLLAFRAALEPYRVDAYLEGTGRLLRSAHRDERHLAQVSLLRAAVWSGRRVLPAACDQALQELMDAESLPAVVRTQTALLWTFRLTMLGPELRPQAEALMDRIAELAGEPARRGIRLLYEGNLECWRFHLDAGIALLEQSAAAFAEAGEEPQRELAERLLLVAYYTANHDAGFRRLLHSLQARSISERPEYAALFCAIVDWQDGDSRALQAEAAAAPGAPPTDAGPLLPRPHFRDYLPFALVALRDRSLDLLPRTEHVDALVDALSVLRPFFAITLGAVAMAQACILHNQLDSARRLAAALIESSAAARIHGQSLQRLIDLHGCAPEPDALVACLHPISAFAERTSTPYYALIAARIACQNDVGRAALAEHLAGEPRFAPLDGRPRQIIAQCVRHLRGEALAPEAGSFERTVQRQLARPVAISAAARTPSPSPAARRLREHLERHWCDAFSLQHYASAQDTSAGALAKRFRRAFDVSPLHYRQQQRIAYAGRLLLETDWDVTQIAHECGFYDAPELIRIFKRDKGLTPLGFRRRWS